MIQFVETEAPRLFDPALPTFRPRPGGNYAGDQIRVKVKLVEGDDQWRHKIEKARREAASDYPGATIVVVSEFQEALNEASEGKEIAAAQSDDERLLRYIEATLPRDLASERDKVYPYLLAQLRKTGEASYLHSQGTSFQVVKGRNILSFKDVSLDLSTPGIRLVLGENRDWEDTSNGAGKSALLQLLRVAAYGSTSKGQDYDRLILRHSELAESCWVEASFKDKAGILCQITRGRRPPVLKFLVNGYDQSSGRNQGYAASTQELVENALGMRSPAFDHSVLIDQTLVHQAHGFLNGTDKDRKDLLAQFLHLERFSHAADHVRQSRMRWKTELENARGNHDWIEARIQEVRGELERLQQSAIVVEAQRELGCIRTELARVGFDSKRLDDLLKQERQCGDLVTVLERAIRDLNYDMQVVTSQIEEAQSGLKEWTSGSRSVCQTCGQPLKPEKVKEQIAKLKADVARLESRRKTLPPQLSAKQSELQEAQRKSQTAETVRRAMQQKKIEHDTKLSQIAALERQIKNSAIGRLQQDLETRIKYYGKLSEIFALACEELIQQQGFYDYCEQAMSRQGIVNFLFSQVCLQLNQAARFYGELFTGGVLQLRFSAVEKLKSGDYADKFSIQVINVQGGEQPEDQSRGEEQLIAFMCVLCLREVGPRSNLLILDEPAEGLDPVNARRLADGLKRLTERIPVILLATHSDVLKAEFRNNQALRVVKEDGMSRLETAGETR